MKTLCLLSLVFVACCFESAPTIAAELRLAIVPADARCAVAGELLTVEFSRSEHGIAVLERAEVERIQREQNLTARSSADFARLGQALGAQGVLVLDLFEQKDATNLTAKLIAVQPGVALGFQSYAWPLKGLKEWPGLVGKQFARLLPKLGVLAQDAVPLSILNLRSPLKTSEGLRLENDATTLLINRLIAQREIFVLERQRMTLLGAEKELKEVQESPFWNGSYLLEGVVERGGTTRDALTINARLVSPARTSQTVSVKSDVGDLNALIDQLAREVISRLGKTTNAIAWNPAAEAKRYLEEARWGMRWGNIPLAQAAADSAWALGEHSVETALIRVNSYAALAPAMWNSEGTSPLGEISPLTPPEPRGLGSLVTALENYLGLTPALGTNASANEWAGAGQKLLAGVAGRLCHFWYFPERAALVTKELDELRSGARELERVVLQGNERPDAHIFTSDAGTNLWQTKINFGWAYAESLEAAVAEIRQLFESGLTRQQREQLINAPRRWLRPWTDAERARSESVWTSFLDGLSLSTNTLDAVSAKLMHVRSPLPSERNQAEAELARRQIEVARIMLAHRRELMCAQPEMARLAAGFLDKVLVQRFRRLPGADAVRTNFVEGIVADSVCFDDGLLAWLFQVDAFETNHLNQVLARIGQESGTNSPAQWRKRFFKAYLAGKNPFRADLFEKLFRAEDFSADEIKAVVARLNGWRDLDRYNRPQNLPLIDLQLAALKSNGTPAPAARELAPVATPPPDPETFNVTKFWAPKFPPVYSLNVTQVVLHHRIIQTLARDGFIWAQVRARAEFRWPHENPGVFYISNRVYEQFYRIDTTEFSETKSPAAWPEGMLELPLNMFGPYAGLAARDGVLFVHENGKLSSWEGRAANWRAIDVALPGQMTLQAIGERFYFGSADAVLEFNPANLTLRTMASRRRNPPVVAEDRLPSYGKPIFLKGTGGTVLVTLGGAVHPWNVDTGTWGESFTSGAAGWGRGRLSPEQDSVLYWEGQPYEDRKLRRFTGAAGDELLLEVKRQNSMPSVARRSATVSATALWKAPVNIDNFSLVTARDGTNLWGFDARQSALTYFDRRWEEPLTVKLSLMPKVLTNDAPIGEQYDFIPARDGLIVFRKMAEGFWFIPKREIDAALAKISATRGPARQLVAVKTHPLVANTNNSAWADEAMPDAAQIIRKYEKTKPGALDMDELVSAIRREPVLAPYRSLFKNFQTSLLLIDPYDTNGNQRIDVPELDAMIKAGKPRVTREEFMARWDTNRNDRFDMPEIRAASAEKNASRLRPRNSITNSPTRTAPQ